MDFQVHRPQGRPRLRPYECPACRGIKWLYYARGRKCYGLASAPHAPVAIELSLLTAASTPSTEGLDVR